MQLHLSEDVKSQRYYGELFLGWQTCCRLNVQQKFGSYEIFWQPLLQVALWIQELGNFLCFSFPDYNVIGGKDRQG